VSSLSVDATAALWPFHLALLQEARGQGRGVAAMAREHGRVLYRGKPAPTGGPLLAGLCDPARAREVGALADHPSGRLQGFALCLRAGLALRVAQVYGYTGAPERAGPLIDAALEWLAEGGQAPAALVGDFNATAEETGRWPLLAAAGWADAGAHLGPTCRPSGGVERRIDQVWLNPAAAAITETVALRWDVGVATHGALCVQFRAAAPPRARVRVAPARLGGGPPAEGWEPEAPTREFRQACAAACGLAEGGQPEQAWHAVEAAACNWLTARAGVERTQPGRRRVRARWQAVAPPRVDAEGRAAGKEVAGLVLQARRLAHALAAWPEGQARPHRAARLLAGVAGEPGGPPPAEAGLAAPRSWAELVAAHGASRLGLEGLVDLARAAAAAASHPRRPRPQGPVGRVGVAVVARRGPGAVEMGSDGARSPPGA
jgi:hypothetical protein